MADDSGTPSPDEPPDVGDERRWVPLARAAELAGCSEEWLMDRCRDGRLPRRAAPGEGGGSGGAGGGSSFVVPLATARALAACEITD